MAVWVIVPAVETGKVPGIYRTWCLLVWVLDSMAGL